MVKENRILIFIIGFLCAWVLLSAPLKKAIGQSPIPPSVTFSGASDVIYFFDRENAKIYRYNTQGRMTRAYVVRELGESLDKVRE